MKTEWNYTELATAYLKRPDYSSPLINSLLKLAAFPSKVKLSICDIGAGVAHLTLLLAENERNEIVAVEPNDAMRANGIERTQHLKNVNWVEACAEDTKQKDSHFDLVTFGSSFNVCNQQQAMLEAHRLLIADGSFACMWNHRDLTDDLQSEIESIIKHNVPDYNYGSRREDPTSTIEKSNLFKNTINMSARIIHTQTVEECVEAWRSHGTLHRQAKEKFGSIIKDIDQLLKSRSNTIIEIPYTTNMWMATKK